MPRRQLKTVLFDLDDCLYRVPEMPELVRENIQRQFTLHASLSWILIQHVITSCVHCSLHAEQAGYTS